MSLYYIVYLIPIIGILGLIFISIQTLWIKKQSSGNKQMLKIANAISKGAMSFLKAEWRVLAYFVVIAAILLMWSGMSDKVESHPIIAISFIIGALLSAFAGYLGMNIATKANVRTTKAAQNSLSKAFRIAFAGGTVMGVGVASLAILGLGLLFIILYLIFGSNSDALTNSNEIKLILEVISGFSLGAESIALFARVGGGIYTKAADVGADLVGKIEANIPEDDPRNPATIADNVGDNVGDVAGMGADLFGSYVATILATMILGQEVISSKTGDMSLVILPLLIGACGLMFSIVSSFFVRINKDYHSVQNAVNKGNWISILLTVIASYFIIQWIVPDLPLRLKRGGEEFLASGIFLSVLLGLFIGAIMNIITEYYTYMGRKPVNSIVKKSATGHATNIIGGLSVGMESTFIPIIVLAIGIYLSYDFAGLYGVGITATGMMATTAMQLSIDAFGPIADNAGGIAEMSGLGKEVRERTDKLDTVGNTTAATGKGFAIASAALTSLALFAAFVGLSNIDSIDIYRADVLAGLFVGAMIPFLFSSLVISSVGDAAMNMVNEVRRQFRDIKGIMEGKAEPDYEKCIEISTNSSIKKMLLPGSITILSPIIVGFSFGPEVLGGFLAGVTVSGVLMGIFQNNAGGAWDNAKKSFEGGVKIDGKLQDKTSQAYKSSVTGDTVGDPLKDTSGPSMNILIKLTSIVAIIIAPHIAIKEKETYFSQNKDEYKTKIYKKVESKYKSKNEN